MQAGMQRSRTVGHKDKACKEVCKGVDLVALAFKCRIASFKVSTKGHFVEIDKFMGDVKSNFFT